MNIGKLDPQVPSSPSSTSLVGKLNFPGFQEILDFTSAGSESSVSVAVDGDTDKEYKIEVRNLSGTGVLITFNGDSGSNYGDQYILNSSGSISAGRGSSTRWALNQNSLADIPVLSPSGSIKTGFVVECRRDSGTTIATYIARGKSYSPTSNISSIEFACESGSFTSGTRITVYARRSQA